MDLVLTNHSRGGEGLGVGGLSKSWYNRVLIMRYLLSSSMEMVMMSRYVPLSEGSEHLITSQISSSTRY